VRCRESLVELIPRKLAPLGFDIAPVEPEISDGRIGVTVVLNGSFEFLIRDGEPFGPSRARVQRVAVESLKRRESDARICEHVIDFDRPDHDRLLRHGRNDRNI
jgi:hypothetical protein